MQSMLPIQSTFLSHKNEDSVVNQAQSNYANQLVVERRSYATLQDIELSKGDYQQLNK